MELKNRWTKEPWNLTLSEASVMVVIEASGPDGAPLAKLAMEGLAYLDPYEERVQAQVRRVIGDIRRKLGKGAIVTTHRGWALGVVEDEGSVAS